MNDALHQALAKARLSDDQSAIVILHGAGDDLGGRSRVIVHQNYQRRPIGIRIARFVFAVVHAVAAFLRQD